MTTTDQCLRGHDIATVGRSGQRMCHQCLRDWNRVRNARRRADPAYRAAENAYKTSWWQFRGYSLALNTRADRTIQNMHTLFASLSPSYQTLLSGLAPEALPPERPWDGDPHNLRAPIGSYRSRPGYPRVTRETVAEQAEKPYIQVRRRLAGWTPQA